MKRRLFLFRCLYRSSSGELSPESGTEPGRRADRQRYRWSLSLVADASLGGLALLSKLNLWVWSGSPLLQLPLVLPCER